MTNMQWATRPQNQPKFRTNETVHFLGGVGTIKNYRPSSGTWTYTVEMEMGLEPPETGRVGFETTILLDEVDIKGCKTFNVLPLNT